MAELITEIILPGTYIEVRAEGLLTVGAIATGNVGIIGTAERGNADIATLSSFDEGRARFGEMGAWDSRSQQGNLTLVRALKYLFDNGARTIYAQRVFDASKAKYATYTLTNAAGAAVLTLKAKTPGTWGNRLQVRVEQADTQELVSDELVARSNGNFRVSASDVFTPTAPPSGGGAAPTTSGNGNGAASAAEPPSIGKVTIRDQGLVQTLQLKHIGPTDQAAQIAKSGETYTLNFKTPPSQSAEVRASYLATKDGLRKVTLRFGNSQEVYIVPSISYLAQVLEDQTNPSKLVIVERRTGDGLPKTTERFESFGKTQAEQGDNGTVTVADYQLALDKLIEQNVQIVVVVGPTFSEIKSAILGHVERTENLGRERIAVVGADSSDVEKILENANDVADKRVILVAPGLRERDASTGQTIDLPPGFAAAAVAGKLSSFAPHISLTNKTLASIDGLAAEYNYGDLKALVQNRVLALERRRGMRVVKGITTDDEAFKQISVRRIVDYAKEGTRQGASQYIGKLNNRRVRENLRTTLDGFLADMLIREFLTGYKLAVFADRAMEIRGEVQVIMDLNPTFSIDVIRVIMNLS